MIDYASKTTTSESNQNIISRHHTKMIMDYHFAFINFLCCSELVTFQPKPCFT